jgi:hypothetical protein
MFELTIVDGGLEFEPGEVRSLFEELMLVGEQGKI